MLSWHLPWHKRRKAECGKSWMPFYGQLNQRWLQSTKIRMKVFWSPAADYDGIPHLQCHLRYSPLVPIPLLCWIQRISPLLQCRFSNPFKPHLDTNDDLQINILPSSTSPRPTLSLSFLSIDVHVNLNDMTYQEYPVLSLLMMLWRRRSVQLWWKPQKLWDCYRTNPLLARRPNCPPY